MMAEKGLGRGNTGQPAHLSAVCPLRVQHCVFATGEGPVAVWLRGDFFLRILNVVEPIIDQLVATRPANFVLSMDARVYSNSQNSQSMPCVVPLKMSQQDPATPALKISLKY